MKTSQTYSLDKIPKNTTPVELASVKRTYPELLVVATATLGAIAPDLQCDSYKKFEKRTEKKKRKKGNVRFSTNT